VVPLTATVRIYWRERGRSFESLLGLGDNTYVKYRSPIGCLRLFRELSLVNPKYNSRRGGTRENVLWRTTGRLPKWGRSLWVTRHPITRLMCIWDLLRRIAMAYCATCNRGSRLFLIDLVVTSQSLPSTTHTVQNLGLSRLK